MKITIKYKGFELEYLKRDRPESINTILKSFSDAYLKIERRPVVGSIDKVFVDGVPIDSNKIKEDFFVDVSKEGKK